jgi:hypothetical protein
MDFFELDEIFEVLLVGWIIFYFVKLLLSLDIEPFMLQSLFAIRSLLRILVQEEFHEIHILFLLLSYEFSLIHNFEQFLVFRRVEI